MKVAFIGHRTVDGEEEVKEKVIEAVKRLIEFENADNFCFGSKSDFNSLSYIVVTELKEK